MSKTKSTETRLEKTVPHSSLVIVAFGRGHVIVADKPKPNRQAEIRAEMAADASYLLTPERAQLFLAIAKTHNLDDATIKYAEAAKVGASDPELRKAFIEKYLEENLFSQEMMHIEPAYTIRVWGCDNLGQIALKGPVNGTVIDPTPRGLMIPGTAIHGVWNVDGNADKAWRAAMSKAEAELLRSSG